SRRRRGRASRSARCRGTPRAPRARVPARAARFRPREPRRRFPRSPHHRAPSRPMLQPAGIAPPRIAVAALLVASSLALAGAAPAHERALVCSAAGGKTAVKAPRFVRNIATGETGWFASPGLVDLNGDGKLEIVVPFYSTFVFDAKGRLLGKGTATKGRVYAPGGVGDLDADKLPEIVVGGNE